MHFPGGIGFDQGYKRIFCVIGKAYTGQVKIRKQRFFPFLKVLEEYPSVARSSTTHFQVSNK